MGWLGIFFVVGVGAATVLMRRWRMEEYTQRGCAGRSWWRRFPGVGKQELREFLWLFADSFLVKRKHALKFRPEDRLMDIYHAINSGWWPVDAMELEMFRQELEERFEINLEKLSGEDLTLGQVFEATRSL